MAVWQVDFAIVPRRALVANPGVALSRVLDTDWWGKERLPADFARQLAAGVSVGDSSTPDVQSWGEGDGNRVDVWSEHGRPVRMIARVDLRRLDAKFSAMLLQFARIADAVFVRGDGLVVEPLVGAFGAALRSSKAWQFANDPAAHFASYADPVNDDE